MSVNRVSTHLSQYAPLESRETAVQFMESIPVGIYIMKMDVEGNPSFSYVSDRFLKMFDLDRQAVLSDAYAAFNCVHPEDYDEFVALNQKVFKECIPFYWEGRCVVRGETIWVIAESIPRKLASGDIIWEGSCSDISKQKMAELQLKKNEVHIRSLLDNSPVPTATNSMENGTITYLNQSFIDTFGYTLSDIPTVSEWAVKAYPDRQYREEEIGRAHV
jgi:PAS domain S-box-containing protein